MNVADNHKKFWQLFESGRWEPWTYELMAEVLKPGDLFVDVGAWIGPLCVWAQRMGAQCIAIEPSPSALPELADNTAAAGAEIWAGALELHTGHTFITPRLDSCNRITDAEDPSAIEVPCWTLEDILAGRKPALVSMDIEGYEMVLLPAIAPLVADLGAVLAASLHDAVPPRWWFTNFTRVKIPATPRRGPTGSSRLVIARP